MTCRGPVLGSIVALALLAGCASDVPEAAPIQPVDALDWRTEVDQEITGLPIAVGSQSQPLDLVLGSIAAETLVAGGADVTEDLDLGDTQGTREAQLAGLIDLYWETTGTGWLSHLREIGPSEDPEQLYEDVRDEDLDENGIVWLPPAPADIGLGIVASPDVVEEWDIADLSQLAAALEDPDEGLVVCVSAVDRPLDSPGLAALADAADVRIRPRLVNPVAPSEIIDLAEDGSFCPFALVEHLDVRLEDADLVFLEDDLGAFVAEQPSITVREDTYAMASGLEDLFAPVVEALDIETLRELVSRVTQDDEAPRDVAREWLIDEGFAEP